jgi:hypothetical protein
MWKLNYNPRGRLVRLRSRHALQSRKDSCSTMAPRASLKRKLGLPSSGVDEAADSLSVTIEPAIALQGLVYKDIFMQVPLHHWDPENSETIRIHAREVSRRCYVMASRTCGDLAEP